MYSEAAATMASKVSEIESIVSSLNISKADIKHDIKDWARKCVQPLNYSCDINKLKPMWLNISHGDPLTQARCGR